MKWTYTSGGKLKHVEKWEFSPKLMTNTVIIHGFSKGPSWLIFSNVNVDFD
jgi:hypothetical protein